MYPSVAVGNHSVTVRGTSQDGQSTNEVTLSPLEIMLNLVVRTSVSATGTVITVIIDANQDATFECQLDDAKFIPCMQQATSFTSIAIQLVTLYLFIPYILGNFRGKIISLFPQIFI